MRRTPAAPASAAFIFQPLIAIVVAVGVIGSPLAVAITPEQAQTIGWVAAKKAPPLFTAEWLSARYDVKIASVEIQQFQTPGPSISVCSITPSDPASRKKLWTALERDRTPDQALVREGETLILFVTEDARERERGVTLVKADQKAESMPRFAWLVDELPKQIPSLMFSQASFRPDLMAQESKVGTSLDAVYQVDYRLRSVPLARQLSQVTFWIPRDASKAAGPRPRAAGPADRRTDDPDGKGRRRCRAVVQRRRSPAARRASAIERLSDRVRTGGEEDNVRPARGRDSQVTLFGRG